MEGGAEGVGVGCCEGGEEEGGLLVEDMGELRGGGVLGLVCVWGVD